MQFGFFAQPIAIDEYESLGSTAIPGTRSYRHQVSTFPGMTRTPARYAFNVDAAAEPSPDQEFIVSGSVISYTGNNNGNAGDNEFRGWRYSAATVRLNIKNRVRYTKASEVGGLILITTLEARSTAINITAFRNLRTLIMGGLMTTCPGVLGHGPNIVTFRYNANVNITAFTTIERRFGARAQQIVIGLSGVGSVINDRLSEAVSLRDLWLANPAIDPTYLSAPYGGSSVPSAIANAFLTGYTTLALDHCPNLRCLVVGNFSGLTSLTIPATCPLELVYVPSATGITNAQMLALMDAAFASSSLVKFMVPSCAKTWTRNITNAEVTNALIVLFTSGNVWTGTITITSTRASLAVITIGTFTTSITVAASKNNHSTVNISGVTNPLSLDLSNSRISDLTLPPGATACTLLAIGGNKLDTTVNTSLIAQIQAMTALTALYLSAGGTTAANMENGQDSTNGFGAGLNLSVLTALVTFWANVCKLTGMLTLPSTVVTVAVMNNNLSGLTGPGTSLRSLLTSNNTLNLNFATMVIHNVTTLQMIATGQTAINLAGKSITTVYADLTIQNNASLVSISFPSTAANAVFTSGIVIIITGNAALTTFTNLVNLTHLTTGTNVAVQFQGNALDIDFAFGSRTGWTPSSIQLQNNGMSSANVNANINSIWTNRRAWADLGSKSFNISGTNGAATGTEVAPSGYKTANLTAITKATTAVATVSAIGTLANNDVIRIRNVVGMTQVNGIFFMIKNISGNTFELYDETGTTPINSTAYTTYTSGGVVFVEGTPANEKEKIYVLENAYVWTITNN